MTAMEIPPSKSFRNFHIFPGHKDNLALNNFVRWFDGQGRFKIWRAAFEGVLGKTLRILTKLMNFLTVQPTQLQSDQHINVTREKFVQLHSPPSRFDIVLTGKPPKSFVESSAPHIGAEQRNHCMTRKTKVLTCNSRFRAPRLSSHLCRYEMFTSAALWRNKR